MEWERGAKSDHKPLAEPHRAEEEEEGGRPKKKRERERGDEERTVQSEEGVAVWGLWCGVTGPQCVCVSGGEASELQYSGLELLVIQAQKDF